MSFLEAVLYGLIQGITEYLPVSSSAHLILLPKFLGYFGVGSPDPGLAFDVFLHMGTLLATLVFYRKDWVKICRDRNLIMKMVAGTLPALGVGFVFHKQIETALRGHQVLAVTLALGGILLYGIDRRGETQGRAGTLESITLKDALVVGLFQCLALIPGMSRSGSTIIGSRVIGLSRAESARFSFLLSAPITFCAIAYELTKWREFVDTSAGQSLGVFLAAVVSSGVFGWLAIGGLIAWIKGRGFGWFALYRVGLAITIVSLF